MDKRVYLFLAGAMALVLTNSTFRNIEYFPIIKELSPYGYRLLLARGWPVLETAVGTYAGSWLVWFMGLALLAFMVDEIGGRYGIDCSRTLLACLVITPALVGLQPGGAFWNLIEAVFYAAAVLLIADGRKWPLFPLVILATLNRETAVFIPLLYFLMTKDWRTALGLFVVWAAVYGAVRWYVGPLPHDLALAEIFAVNFGAGFGRFFLGLMMVVWLLWYSFKGWKMAPDQLRRAALLVPAYLALVAVFGIWHEWRLLISLYPLLVPLAGVVIS